jgi:hypothetical protein
MIGVAALAALAAAAPAAEPDSAAVTAAFATAELAFMGHVVELRLGPGADASAGVARVKITDCFLGAACARGAVEVTFALGDGPSPLDVANDYLFLLGRGVKVAGAFALATGDHTFRKSDDLWSPPSAGTQRYVLAAGGCGGGTTRYAHVTRAELVAWGRARAPEGKR